MATICKSAMVCLVVLALSIIGVNANTKGLVKALDTDYGMVFQFDNVSLNENDLLLL